MEMSTALWSLIAQTDSITKIILLGLLSMSIICWTLALYKLVLLRSRIKELKQLHHMLNRTATLEELRARAALLGDTFGGMLIARYLTECKSYIKAQSTDQLQHKLSVVIDEALQQEEGYVPVLSTSAAAAPLVGLFGTVWGLIHAFLGIGMRKGADIAAVAPGIAEALITTLGGLVVAIPALVLFSYIHARLRTFEHLLVVVADRCALLVQNTLHEHRVGQDTEHIQGHIKTATVTDARG